MARETSPNPEDTSIHPAIIVVLVCSLLVILIAPTCFLYKFWRSRLNTWRNGSADSDNRPLVKQDRYDMALNPLSPVSRGAIAPPILELNRSTRTSPSGVRSTRTGLVELRTPPMSAVSPPPLSQRRQASRLRPLLLGNPNFDIRNTIRRDDSLRSFLPILDSPATAAEFPINSVRSPLERLLQDIPLALRTAPPPNPLRPYSPFTGSEVVTSTVLSPTNASRNNENIPKRTIRNDQRTTRNDQTTTHANEMANKQLPPVPNSNPVPRFTNPVMGERNSDDRRVTITRPMHRRGASAGMGINSRTIQYQPWHQHSLPNPETPRQVPPNPETPQQNLPNPGTPQRSRPLPRIAPQMIRASRPANLEHRSLSDILSRSLSSSTTTHALSPPPYTPMCVNFLDPSRPPTPPEKAHIVPDSIRDAGYSGASGSVPLSLRRTVAPTPLPPIDTSPLFPRAPLEEIGPITDHNNQGTLVPTHRRSRTLPTKDQTLASVPLWGGAHVKMDTPKNTRFAAGPGVDTEWPSTRMDKIMSSRVIRDSFIIDV